MHSLLRRNSRKLVAFGVVLALYFATRLPQLPLAERAELAREYAFTPIRLPELDGAERQSIRDVHPDLAHISAWISSVGAACSLSDIDDDGLSNDICYVDTRTNRVIVQPVPGPAPRYAPFCLDPSPLTFDDDTMAPMGCVPGDLNEDGLLDVLVYYWGRTPIAFLRRASASQPKQCSADQFVAHEICRTVERWFTNAATRSDIDGDGHADLIFGNYFPDGARILDPQATDRQHMHHAMSRAYNGGTNRLFLWEPSADRNQVKYREVGDVWNDDVANSWTLAVGAADLDGDMLPELYFSNDFGHDRLFHNRSTPGNPKFAELVGRKRFTTPNSKVLGRDSFKGMGVDFGDLNGDGWLDIYVSNIAEVFALEESHFVFVSTGQPELMKDGIAPYQEQSEALGLSRSGWGWESRLADFNNDGVLEAVQATGFVKGLRNRWPQLHEAAMGNDLLLRYADTWHRIGPNDDLSGHNPNPFFVRSSSGRYFDLAADLGLDTPQVTRGISTADVDGDGDLDFLIANQWDASKFYRNDCPNPGRFLGLRLRIPVKDPDADNRAAPNTPVAPPSRAAIGASVRVKIDDGRVLVGQVDGGNGHSGTRSPELHFGLGDVPKTKQLDVDISWRDEQGRVCRRALSLSPGWHNLMLKSPSAGDMANKSRSSDYVRPVSKDILRDYRADLESNDE